LVDFNTESASLESGLGIQLGKKSKPKRRNSMKQTTNTLISGNIQREKTKRKKRNFIHTHTLMIEI
jgi:hypothetical protein